ncbi:unnamed protein product [Zymoseptoria tritici ST99CH_3D1]|uniref:Uncharacterized protein n=1 Tax=Zymoseptoria tritici ST99CH_1E4 TaxID=1276532 RepID=A0A2H1FY00_ZYMTR|nr:unnamed protein product [Zymoseptoria tritici ST99CH_1E4]SMR47426.1 unnamed protein product [Zymoseptoria tritici ST99CH_3D1]
MDKNGLKYYPRSHANTLALEAMRPEELDKFHSEGQAVTPLYAPSAAVPDFLPHSLAACEPYPEQPSLAGNNPVDDSAYGSMLEDFAGDAFDRISTINDTIDPALLDEQFNNDYEHGEVDEAQLDCLSQLVQTAGQDMDADEGSLDTQLDHVRLQDDDAFDGALLGDLLAVPPPPPPPTTVEVDPMQLSGNDFVRFFASVDLYLDTDREERRTKNARPAGGNSKDDPSLLIFKCKVGSYTVNKLVKILVHQNACMKRSSTHASRGQSTMQTGSGMSKDLR